VGESRVRSTNFEASWSRRQFRQQLREKAAALAGPSRRNVPYSAEKAPRSPPIDGTTIHDQAPQTVVSMMQTGRIEAQTAGSAEA